MASLIPNDPQSRKTFTYLEHNWHTEMNRNLTLLVNQANKSTSDFTALANRVTAAETALAEQALNLTDLTELINDAVSKELAAAERASDALAVLETDAATGVAVLDTTLTRYAVKAGTKLIAFDPTTRMRGIVTVKTDTPAGSGTIPVEATTSAYTKGTSLRVSSADTQGVIGSQSEAISSLLEQLTEVNGTATTNRSLIQQSADEILLLVQRLEDTETELGNVSTELMTQIQMTADQIALKADKTVVDAQGETILDHSTAITQNAESISLTASQIDVVNDLVTEYNARLDITAQQISSLVSSVQLVDGKVTTFSSWRSQTDTQFADVVQRLDATESGLIANSSQIQQHADEIAQRVLKATFDNAIKGPAFTKTTANTSGSNISSLPVESIPSEILKDFELLALNMTTGARYILVITSAHAKNASAINFTPTSLNLPAGSPIFMPDSFVSSQFVQTAENFKWTLFGGTDDPDSPGFGERQVAQEMELCMEGFKLDVTKMFSDGSTWLVDANGNVNYPASGEPKGWVITGQGNVGFSSAKLWGELRAAQGQVKIDGSGLTLPFQVAGGPVEASDLKWISGSTSLRFRPYLIGSAPSVELASSPGGGEFKMTMQLDNKGQPAYLGYVEIKGTNISRSSKNGGGSQYIKIDDVEVYQLFQDIKNHIEGAATSFGATIAHDLRYFTKEEISREHGAIRSDMAAMMNDKIAPLATRGYVDTVHGQLSTRLAILEDLVNSIQAGT